MKTKQSDTLKKTLAYIGKYRVFLIFSLIFAFISTILTLCIPLLTGKAVDYILGAGQVDFRGCIKVIIMIAISAIVSALSQWLMNILNNKMTCSVVRDLRNEAFERLERLPLKYLDGQPAGDIVSRVTADADQLADGLLMGSTQIFTGVVTIIGTLVFMLGINFLLGIIVVLLTPLSFFVAKFIAKSTFRYSLMQSEVRGRVTGFINEMISGQRVIKAFNHEDKAIQDFAALNGEYKEASLKATFFSSLTNPSTRFVNNTVYAIIACAGAFAAINSLLSVGALVSFLSYAREYTKPFNEISGVVTELQSALACARRLISLIEEPSELPDREDALTLKDPQGNVDIDIKSFSYNEAKPLIRDFELSVSKGQRIAIAGPTGCGKTTLINLLMRFYDVNSGSISVDGVDIRDITRKSLRSSYGMVLQDTWLKSGTIRENLLIGNPGASEEEMVEAAKSCHAHSFIKRLPEGYDTFIPENGGSLSAGQKQLLCIARVMLSKPSMLILDEATSSIDTRTEIRIQKAFHRMMEGKTSFIVAHRLSTIRESDLILVMKDGNIVEKGSHEELIKKQGFYYELYQSQFMGRAI